MNTSSRLPGWMAGRILAVWMASSCIACCIFHIISIPFNCSDTALRITDGKIGQKVMFALFPELGTRTRSQDLWPFLISETGLKFLIWTQGEIHPVNRAHMKRPLNVHSRLRPATWYPTQAFVRSNRHSWTYQLGKEGRLFRFLGVLFIMIQILLKF